MSGLAKVDGIRLLAAGLVMVMAAAFGPAHAQTAAKAPARKPTPVSQLPDWNGMWEKDGHIGFDPRIPIDVPQVPPYNPEYMAMYNKIREASRAARPIADSGASCIPGGMPGMMTTVFPMEVEVTPPVTLILPEGLGIPRRIWTDGRPHPEEVVLPQSDGHSVGYWKNKELFVDTCCLKPTTRLPGGGPHSDALHVVERFWSPDPNTLMLEIKVEDPKAFTKPWTAVKTWHRRPDWEPNEYICDENNRNPIGEDGVTQVILPTEDPK